MVTTQQGLAGFSPHMQTALSDWLNQCEGSRQTCLEALPPGVLDKPDYEAIPVIIRRAHAGAQQWAQVPLRERQACLREWASALERDAVSWAQAIQRETGKPLDVGIKADVLSAVSFLRYLCREGAEALVDRAYPWWKTLALGRTYHTSYHPKGVVVAMTPWNFPLGIAVASLGSALLAGNAVVWKPSEWCPALSDALWASWLSVLQAHGLLERCAASVQCVQGDGATAQTLLAQPIDHVLFTGSARVGQQIARQMAARNVSVSLELGGSCPLVVLPDHSDLDTVASAILWGRGMNSGQACGAVKRVLVHRSQIGNLMTHLQSKLSTLTIGQPTAPTLQTPYPPQPDLGPISTPPQLATLLGQLRDGVKALSDDTPVLVQWPQQPITVDNRLCPYVIAAIDSPTHPWWQDEVFGPFLPILPYDTLDEAITLANDTPYGLTASVFGSPHEAKTLALKLHAGTVTINDVAVVEYVMPHVPWSGWKASGVSHGHAGSHGLGGLLALTRQQTVGVNHLASWPGVRQLFAKAPWWFSKHQTPDTLSAMRGQLRILPESTLLDCLCHVLTQPQALWAFVVGVWHQRGANKR